VTKLRLVTRSYCGACWRERFLYALDVMLQEQRLPMVKANLGDLLTHLFELRGLQYGSVKGGQPAAHLGKAVPHGPSIGFP